MSLPAAAELLASLARLMRKRKLRWYVFGAQAAVAYGRPRMTADVDATVDLGRASVTRFVAELQSAGFSLRFPLTSVFLRSARLIPLVHDSTEMPLDLVIAGRGLEQEFLARARNVDVGGVRVRMVSVEDLVAMKTIAGRRKDLEDVRGVLREQKGRIDLKRTRDVLAAVEEVTGSKLIARLERILRGVEGARPRSRVRRLLVTN